MIIYEIKNKINEQPYIGYSTKFNSTEELLQSDYWGSGSYIKRAIEKYGEIAFERRVLIKNITDRKELKRYEVLWIKKKQSHISQGGYNLTWGGDGGCGGDTFTNNPNKEEIRRKIKEKRQLQITTEKTRTKMRKSKNKYYLEHPEAIEEKREQMTKRYENIEERIKTGKKSKEWWDNHPERKEKQSEELKKQNRDYPERKEKQSEKMKEYWSKNIHPSSKWVILISPKGQEYKILGYAKFCIEHKLSKQCICQVLQGKQKSHRGWSCGFLK
jgi:hypothetical protein